MTGTLRFDEACALVARHFPPTRLVRAESLSRPGSAVHLKIECDLPTGSFKVRGAVYSLSVNAARGPIAEVIAASTGNHGAAVAYAGRLLGIPARVFLPASPNPVKAARIRDLGATIVEIGDFTAAIDAAYEYAGRTGAFFLHDAADADVPCGTATIAREILEQLPPTDAIYVPMGDTALVRGVAAAAKQLKPSIRIVGVVAKGAPAYYESWRRREAIDTASANTIADGLIVRRALAANVAEICALVDEVRLVSDEEMLDAIEWLMTKEGVTAEPSGAAAAAAFMQVSLQAERGATVLLVTGCNIAPEVTATLRDRRLRDRDRQP